MPVLPLTTPYYLDVQTSALCNRQEEDEEDNTSFQPHQAGEVETACMKGITQKQADSCCWGWETGGMGSIFPFQNCTGSLLASIFKLTAYHAHAMPRLLIGGRTQDFFI